MQPAELDQLWFTWTTHGLGSGRGAQVRAATNRLTNGRDRASSIARRYCYQPPGDRAFGWIERDSVRLVFNRVNAGVDGVGREGNYFVHLLLGNPEDLPAEFLWTLYDSPFWVTGDPGGKDTSLPSISANAAGMHPEPYDAGRELPSFMAHLMQCIDRRCGVRLTHRGASSAGLASGASAAFPSQFGLISFSSAESVQSAREYDIVCSDDDLPSFRVYEGVDVSLNLPTIDAANVLLATSESSRSIVRAAAIAESRREFVRNLVTLTAFRTGKEANAQIALSLAVSSPDAIEALLEGPGIDVFADRTTKSDRAALSILPHLTSADQQRLARRVAKVFLDRPAAALPLLQRTSAGAPLFTRTAAREIVEQANDDGSLETLAAIQRVAYVKLLAESKARWSSALDVLLSGNPEVSLAVAADPRMAMPWRVAAALKSPESLHSGAFDDLIIRDASFSNQVFSEIQDIDVQADVERISARLGAAEAIAWIDALEPFVGRDDLETARWNATERIPSPGYLDQLLRECAGRGRLDGALWEDRLLKGLAGSVMKNVRDPDARDLLPRGPALDRLGRLTPRSGSVQAWIRVLDAANRLGPWAGFGTQFDQLANGIFALSGEQRIAAGIVGVDRALCTASRYKDLGRAINRVVNGVPELDREGWARLIQYTAVRAQRSGASPNATGYAIRWTLDQWQSEALSVPRKASDKTTVLAWTAKQIPGPVRSWLHEYIGDWKGKYKRPAKGLLTSTDPNTNSSASVFGRRLKRPADDGGF